METEIWIVVSSAWREGGMGSYYLMGADVRPVGPESLSCDMRDSRFLRKQGEATTRPQEEVHLWSEAVIFVSWWTCLHTALFSMLVEMFPAGRTTEWLLFSKSNQKGEMIRLANWTTVFKRTCRNEILGVENWMINRKRNLFSSIGNLSLNEIIQRAKNRGVSIPKFVTWIYMRNQSRTSTLITCLSNSCFLSHVTHLKQLFPPRSLTWNLSNFRLVPLYLQLPSSSLWDYYGSSAPTGTLTFVLYQWCPLELGQVGYCLWALGRTGPPEEPDVPEVNQSGDEQECSRHKNDTCISKDCQGWAWVQHLCRLQELGFML